MRTIRQHLSWLLTGWLVFHVASALSPLVVFAAGSRAAEETCTCPGIDHAICPMHHPQNRSDRPAHDAESRCRLQNVSTSSDSALLSLAAGIGIVPQRAEFDVVNPRVAMTRTIDTDCLSRPKIPDAPPPRS